MSAQYRLVPVEPTQEQANAADDADPERRRFFVEYQAAVLAAPEPTEWLDTAKRLVQEVVEKELYERRRLYGTQVAAPSDADQAREALHAHLASIMPPKGE